MIILSRKKATRVVNDNHRDAFIVEGKSKEGEKIYSVKIQGKLREILKVYESDWQKDFVRHIHDGKNFPYTTSPATLEVTDLLHARFLEELSAETGVEDEESWAKGKVRDVGQKVLMPDSYWLTGVFNGYIIASWLRKVADKRRIPVFRSLGCGAGVYERSIYEINNDIAGVTTDLKLDSCVRADINFELIGLFDDDKRVDHTIFIGNRVPSEFLTKRKHLLIQCADALEALQEEEKMKMKGDLEGYAAFGMDNFLPYMRLKYVEEVFKRTLSLGSEEFMIQFLGLDKTKVKLSLPYKLMQVLKGSASERFEEILDKEKNDYRFGYKVKYGFDDEAIANEVISVWAGNIYDWLREYFFRGEFRNAMFLMRQINRATGLSALSELVESETVEHHRRLLKMLQNKPNLDYNVNVDPGNVDKDGRMVLRASTITVKRK